MNSLPVTFYFIQIQFAKREKQQQKYGRINIISVRRAFLNLSSHINSCKEKQTLCGRYIFWLDIGWCSYLEQYMKKINDMNIWAGEQRIKQCNCLQCNKGNSLECIEKAFPPKWHRFLFSKQNCDLCHKRSMWKAKVSIKRGNRNQSDQTMHREWFWKKKEMDFLELSTLMSAASKIVSHSERVKILTKAITLIRNENDKCKHAVRNNTAHMFHWNVSQVIWAISMYCAVQCSAIQHKQCAPISKAFHVTLEVDVLPTI